MWQVFVFCYTKDKGEFDYKAAAIATFSYTYEWIISRFHATVKT